MSKKNIHETKNVRQTFNEFKEHAAKEHATKSQSSFYHKLVKKLIADNLLTQAKLDSIILSNSIKMALLNIWYGRYAYMEEPESSYYWEEDEREFKNFDLEGIYVQNMLEQVDKIMELTPEQFHKIKNILLLILKEKISIQRASQLKLEQIRYLYYIQDEIIRGNVSVDDFLKWTVHKSDELIYSTRSLIERNLDFKQIDTLPLWISTSLIGHSSLSGELIKSKLIFEIKKEQLDYLKNIAGIDYKILPISKALELKLTKEEIDKLVTLKEYINKKEITVDTARKVDSEISDKIKKLSYYPNYHSTKFEELVQLLKDDKNDVDQIKRLHPFIPHQMSLAEALRHRISDEESSILADYLFALRETKMPFDTAIRIGRRSTGSLKREISRRLFPLLGILSEDEIVEMSENFALHKDMPYLPREIVDLFKLGYPVDFRKEKLGIRKEIYIIEEIMKVIIPNYLNELLKFLTPLVELGLEGEDARHLILGFLDFTPPEQCSSYTGQTSTPLATNVLTLFAHSAQKILASTQVSTDEHLNQPRT